MFAICLVLNPSHGASCCHGACCLWINLILLEIKLASDMSMINFTAS
jgi:hypothetical protein